MGFGIRNGERFPMMTGWLGRVTLRLLEVVEGMKDKAVMDSRGVLMSL